jgi:hypothetical protein
MPLHPFPDQERKRRRRRRRRRLLGTNGLPVTHQPTRRTSSLPPATVDESRRIGAGKQAAAEDETKREKERERLSRHDNMTPYVVRITHEFTTNQSCRAHFLHILVDRSYQTKRGDQKQGEVEVPRFDVRFANETKGKRERDVEKADVVNEYPSEERLSLSLSLSLSV